MTGKEKLTLMFQDDEVLSFEVDYDKKIVRFLEEKERFDKAPYELGIEDKNLGLMHFFDNRLISSMRVDFKKIAEATNCKSPFELSFRGHGLSLSNHYWYKRDGENLRYDDINFFENRWDDTFGRAVLAGDYEKLKTCDLNVPDILTSGWGVKGWLWEDGPKLYKRGLTPEHPEEAVCEVLASKIANMMLQNGDALHYDLKTIDGKYYSSSPCITKKNEELIPLSTILPTELNAIYYEKIFNKRLNKLFFDRLAEFGHAEWKTFFYKVACLRSLCFISDLHFGNLSAIRNIDTGELRLAPIYDFGGAFGSSNRGKEFIASANKGSFFLIYFLFGDLDPSWDYSWYDPKKLEGAEEVIREYLSKTEFYTPDYIECALEIFRRQKKALDEMAK